MKNRRIIVGFLAVLLALAVLIVCLSGRIEKGSEQVVQGVVVDQAMGKVHEEDFRARSYITLEFEDGTAKLFWLSRSLARQHTTGVRLGDRITVEVAIEAATGLWVITEFLD